MKSVVEPGHMRVLLGTVKDANPYLKSAPVLFTWKLEGFMKDAWLVIV